MMWQAITKMGFAKLNNKLTNILNHLCSVWNSGDLQNIMLIS